MLVTLFSLASFKRPRQLAVACLMSVLIPGINVQAEQPEATTSPYNIAVFKLPEKYQQQLNGYRSQWARLSGFQYSGLHWNQFISVYTNTGATAYENNHKQFLRWYEDPDDEENEPQYKSYPVGTVVLKENYSADEGRPGVPLSLTVMIKQASGYSSKHGDWQFLQISPAGEILLEGSYKDPQVKAACAGCHDNVGDRDFIFSSIYTSHLVPLN